MEKHDQCCVGICNNDKRYPEKYEIHSNVVEGKLTMHRFPTDPDKRKIWTNAVSKGRKGFEPGNYSYVCSNHFVEGKPTIQNPHPMLFLTIMQNNAATPQKKSRPCPRKRIRLQSPTPEIYLGDPVPDNQSTAEDKTTSTEDLGATLHMTFTQITRDTDVLFFTGLVGSIMFKSIFTFVQRKAPTMTYWDGSKKTSRLRKPQSDLDILLSTPEYNLIPLKAGPARKLTLEQEFLMTMMRLRLGLLIEDLAFRLSASPGKVSQILITWIKLLSKELSVLIIWPSRKQIRKTLPDCFRRLYPKVRTIIDCTEVFMDTPSSLETQAYLWSDYKHHCTVKFLIAITPNGSTTAWISPLYGGHSSDIYIVRDSGFLDIIEPFDQVMADRGFKIKTDLAMHQATLCIPPSAAKGSQMTQSDVKSTSNIANVRIYVEQAIKRIKEFRILKTQQPLLYWPLMNDIVQICGALVNLKQPLA